MKIGIMLDRSCCKKVWNQPDPNFSEPTCTITSPKEPYEAASITSPSQNFEATPRFAEWKKLYGHFTWSVDNLIPTGPPHYNAQGGMEINNGVVSVSVRMLQNSGNQFSISFSDGTFFTPSGFTLEAGTQFAFEIERDITSDEWTLRGFVDGVLAAEHTYAASANGPTDDAEWACNWGMGALMWTGFPGPPYRVFDLEDLQLSATYEA